MNKRKQRYGKLVRGWDWRTTPERLQKMEVARAKLDMSKTEFLEWCIDQQTEIKMISVDIDLSEDAMGKAGDTDRYLDMLETELAKAYPGYEIDFTHSGNGRIRADDLDDGEEHGIAAIINHVWERWLNG